MISIIIPVYNHQEALKKALASIQEQTYKDVEVIVVDDGSSSKIDSEFISYIVDIPFRSYIQVVRQENKGAPSARNAGFILSKGEYVIFWDADVIGEREMLEKMLLSLEGNFDVSFVYSNHYFGKKKLPSRHWNTKALKHNNYIHSTSLIRREAVVAWDESLKRFQDWDLWLTMAEEGKSGMWIDEYLFRVIAGGTMSFWLPKILYRKPWRWIPGFSSIVDKYQIAKEIVMSKHGLL